MLNLVLKDQSVRSVNEGESILDVAKSISGRLAKEALCAKLGDKLVDLNYVLTQSDDGKLLEVYRFEDKEGRDAFRHSTSHLMAQAIKNLYPQAKLAIGPSIDNGFYYDIDLEYKLVPEDLPKIEEEMKRLSNLALDIQKSVLSRTEAIKLMKDKGEDYKVELIEELPADEEISFYSQGDFIDLCSGVHISNTKEIKHFKLLSLAGAYWRGSEKNKMLQRIYGTSFPKASMLEEYVNMLEEAKKRDHRRLGKELELFALMDEGPGFPFFLPKGMIVLNELKRYWRELHTRENYDEVETPIILNKGLWETSGHWYHYRDNMYTLSIDEEEYAIKPMNCPGGMLVYKTKPRSYRDFPIRMAEMGRVHRHELSGALHGLMRVRAFTQDDAHIFMLPSQIKDEIMGVCRLTHEIYEKFGFKYHVELSTKPEKSMGSQEDWDHAEASLKAALTELGINYKLNPGDGAFYGPKIDFHLTDSIGRTWQCGTIQLDMQLPQRFELSYIGDDGEKHTPVVIHRAILGSLERFFANVLEEFAGKFPTWLAPVQVKIMTIADRHIEYAKSVQDKLKSLGIRASLDSRAEKIGYKIREAQLEKIPYMVLLGDKDFEANTVSIRSRDLGELGAMSLDEFTSVLVNEIANRSLKQLFNPPTQA